MPTAAVVGTGFIGPVHAEALLRLGIGVRGFLGSSAEKSAQASQKLGLPKAYTSFEEILHDPLVDAVHITTPNKTHLEMSKQALEAGKHVICEKPLAMTAQETAELVRVAQAHPYLVAAVNYNIRFYPVVLHARELVQSGALGEIWTIRGAYIQDWLLYDSDWNWRLLPQEGGDLRAIGDIGTHWMDLMSFVTGLQVKSLLADLATFNPIHKKPRQAVATFKGKEQSGSAEFDPVEITTDDWGSVIFHYENGARGNMSVSQVNAGRKNHLTFEIAGTKGAVAWNSESPNELWLGFRDKPNEILIKDPSLMADLARRYSDYPGGHAEGFPDTFKQLYKAVYGYIAAGDWSAPKPFPTFEEGHAEVVLCEAILDSHRQRRWVEVS